MDGLGEDIQAPGGVGGLLPEGFHGRAGFGQGVVADLFGFAGFGPDPFL